MITLEQIKLLFNLKPLQAEGGYFAETYRSHHLIPEDALPKGYEGKRALSTAIYYLLTPDTFSALHRLPTDEIYHFYLGGTRLRCSSSFLMEKVNLLPLDLI